MKEDFQMEKEQRGNEAELMRAEEAEPLFEFSLFVF